MERHRLGDYTPNVKPIPIPTEYIEKRREIEEKQRAFEREIRYCKRRVIISDNKAERAKYRERAKALNARYEAFSRDNKAAFFRERTKIFDENN